jgi:hypothetical protein
MRAEILGIHSRFEVQPELREDGTKRPPERITVSIRPCWRTPPQKLELTYLYELDSVAYYGVKQNR